MKKILYSLLAASAMLFVAGCQKEAEEPGGANTVEVSFDIQFDGLSTKAFADGMSVNELYVGVYDSKTGEIISNVSAAKLPISGGSASYSAGLLKGRSYTLAFWAQKAENGLYSVSLSDKKVTANYASNPACNNDAYDCFYDIVTLTDLEEAVTKEIKLTRPVAQINVLSSENDVAAAKVLGLSPASSSITVDGVQNVFGLTDGKLSGDAKTVSFTETPCEEPSFLPGYKYVAMVYVLADAKANANKTVTLNMGLKKDGETNASVYHNFDITNVPIRRNFRTNIIGSVFTAETSFEIDVDSDFAGTNNMEILKSVKAPEFNPDGGEVKAGSTVTITSETGAKIYYTVDGSEPTEESTLYTEPIVINEAVTIKAFATKENMYPSATVTAAFTIKEGGDEPEPGEEVTDVLDNAKIGVSGTTYSEWSGVKDQSNAVYAGNTAGGNSAIQMRTNNNNSGIVTTTSGGIAKKVIIAWNSNTADARVLSVYASNTAYGSPADLYDESTAGTLVGELAKASNDTELSIPGSYTYVGIRSQSGALYLDSFSVIWAGEGGDEPGGDEPGGDEPGGDEPGEAEEGTIAYMLSQIPTTATGNNTAVTFSMTLNGAVVSYVNGRNAYLEDESGAVLFYKDGHGLEAGDIISGEVSVKGYFYNNLPEIVDLGDAYDKESGGEIPLTIITLADLLNDYEANLSRRVKIKDVSVSDGISDGDRNGVIIQGNDEINVYAQLNNAGLELTEGAEGDFIAFVGIYKENKQLAFWDNEQFIEGGSDDPEPGDEPGDEPGETAITIDGDLSDWDDIDGTSNGSYGMFKAAIDDEYLYLYAFRTTEGRYSDIWGGSGYIYIGFELDGDASNNTAQLWASEKYDLLLLVYPYGGSANAKEIDASGGENRTCEPTQYTMENTYCDGVIDDEGAKIEMRIPLSDLPEFPGTEVTITTWGNKDLSKVVHTCTL